MKTILKLLSGGVRDGNWGILILRVGAGTAMMTHGYDKLFGGLKLMTENVGNLGFPAPWLFAFAAAFSEFFGALFLALGLLTRLWASLLAVTMATAFFIAHAGQPFILRELAFLYLLIFFLFILKGGGKYSIDSHIAKKL